MIAIYPGSFDPVTNGHMDIIRRGAAISERLIVGLLVNSLKQSLFTIEERLMHLKLVTEDLENVEVQTFSGLLIDFAKMNGCSTVIRGIRTGVIDDYELQMALGNQQVGNVETLFMLSRPENMYISSTIVKQVLFGNNKIDTMVPAQIVPHLLKKVNTK